MNYIEEYNEEFEKAYSDTTAWEKAYEDVAAKKELKKCFYTLDIEKEGITLEEEVNKLVEETMEVVEAYRNKDIPNLREEIGDAITVLINIANRAGISIESVAEEQYYKHRARKRFDILEPVLKVI